MHRGVPRARPPNPEQGSLLIPVLTSVITVREDSDVSSGESLI